MPKPHLCAHNEIALGLLNVRGSRWVVRVRLTNLIGVVQS